MTSFRRSFQLSPYTRQFCGCISRSIVSYLAARRLGEPESPLVLKRVLDIEVGLVVEDGDGLAVRAGLTTLLVAGGRDGDRGQVNLLVHAVALCGGGSHLDGSLEIRKTE